VFVEIKQAMITRIEIDGFKSFHQFAMDLRPFQVIIGPNGVGKSNLFDALMLLARLANGDSLFDAFKGSRGSVLEQFSLLEDGSRSKQMTFAVEILLPKTYKYTGVSGEKFPVKFNTTRYRYELRVVRSEESIQKLYINNESLHPIPADKDGWLKSDVQRAWLNFDTYPPHFLIEDEEFHLTLHNRKTPIELNNNADKNMRQTGLSIAAGVDDHIKQIALNIARWQSLQSNPSMLKPASSGFIQADSLLPDGSNLAAVLYRLSKEDEFALNDITRDMIRLNHNINMIDVRHDEFQDSLAFRVQDQNGNWLSPNVLSDGTLRTLAFVTLRNDPNFEGVICIEEPENGVHPLVLEKLVKMFQSMATDFSDTEMPLRQIIINTHSPALLAYVDKEDIAYMYMPRHNPRITRVGTITDNEADEAKRLFTRHQIMNFLNSTPKHELDHA
jgi:predicted ATPase